MPTPVTRAVVVMGKVPRPGRVKTRLTARYTPEVAAQLYRAFLSDTFRLVDRAAAGADWRRVFACALAPDETSADAEALVPPGWRVVVQQGDGLGARIDHARRSGEAAHVLVMGSDIPALPAERLGEAFRALAEADGGPGVVLVPTDDGGYALIGFNGPAEAVLTDIPWSTPEVMAVTRTAAARAGVWLHALPSTYDIDHPEDLARLARDVHPERHPATAAALDSLL